MQRTCLPRTRSLILIAGLALSAATPLLAQDEATGDETLPVRRITLYRSGVGYFERAGQIQETAEVQLRFETDQINDILKSLVLLDLDGGRIDAVSYASKEPLERRLASFGVNISGNPSIPELLGQLRGAPISVTSVEGKVTGTILGVEERLVAPQGDYEPYRTPFLNVVTPNGLKSIRIAEITAFEILDTELSEELTKALAALAEYRADDTKTVDLRFSGEGSRRVVVGYVHETPVWKASYRLVLPEPGGESAKSPFMLQGWAIVENTTDQDWNNVQLGLVSGRPVSFVMDLYEPLYTYRPEVPVPTVPGVSPRAYAAGQNAVLGRRLQEAQQAGFGNRTTEKARRRMTSDMSENAMVPPGEAAAPYAGVTADEMVGYGAQAQAEGGLVGEVFKYELEAPVTIERQRSAMIPIINADLAGRRVSIFSLSDGSQHPMRGVEITNDSDLQLLPGPIAVFDGAAYAGDAQIGHIGAGDKRLLAYSVDLDVAVLTETEDASNLRKVRIVDGLLEQTWTRQNKVTYAFENKDQHSPRTMVVEQARLHGWDLVNPKKPAEQTQESYRFELDVPSGESNTLSVVQERTEMQSLAVLSFDLATAIAYHRDGKLSDKVLEVIREAARRQSEINTYERQIQEIDRQRQAIHEEQNRIRSNMNSVRDSSDLYARYVQKLDAQETQLETLLTQRDAAQQMMEQKRTELNDYLRGLDVE